MGQEKDWKLCEEKIIGVSYNTAKLEQLVQEKEGKRSCWGQESEVTTFRYSQIRRKGYTS